MIISDDKAALIIEQFIKAHDIVLSDDAIHGIDVVLIEGAPSIRLCIQNQGALVFQNFDAFIADINGEELRLKVLAEEVEIPDVHYSPGDSAAPSGVNYYGTAGWNFYLGDDPMVMSNWHVLCDSGNNTPIGRRVLLDGKNIAGLNWFVKIKENDVNIWDLALAKLDESYHLSAYMRRCPDQECPPRVDPCIGPRYENPVNIASRVEINMLCRKIGAREPICRYEIIKGFGTRRVRLRDFTATFERQVIFGKMSDPGDSGSVIFKDEGGSIVAVALNFAGNNTETIGNPLRFSGLRKIGDRIIPSPGPLPLPPGYNLTVPIFEDRRASGQTNDESETIF
jgi:hypothetical protein